MNFRVISPQTGEELLKVLSSMEGENFRIGAGYTDLLVEFQKQPPEDITVVNLGLLKEDLFTSVTPLDEGVRVGAMVTAGEIQRNTFLRSQYPVLCEAAERMASRQIRAVATVGGNLCTASPAGDIACALTALSAQCELLSAEGATATVPIQSFFTGVRKTVLQKNQVLRSVFIPANVPSLKLFSDYIKVGTRLSMECAVVSLAYHIQLDEAGYIIKAGAALGSSAPTIRYLESACAYLKDRRAGEIDAPTAEGFARQVLEYASPISDIRASAWYRSQVIFNISKGLLEDCRNSL